MPSLGSSRTSEFEDGLTTCSDATTLLLRPCLCLFRYPTYSVYMILNKPSASRRISIALISWKGRKTRARLCGNVTEHDNVTFETIPQINRTRPLRYTTNLVARLLGSAASRDGCVRHRRVRSPDLEAKLLSDEVGSLLADEESGRVRVSAEVVLCINMVRCECDQNIPGGYSRGKY